MNDTKTILLIEDDALVIKGYDYFLQKAGYNVLLATNASEALRHLRAKKPDLILMDLVMPGMDGFELLEELNAQGITSEIPVIIISNLGQDDTIVRCQSLGAVDYIVKANFFMRDVVKKVEQHLNSFQPR